jgi:hypothetical protein
MDCWFMSAPIPMPSPAAMMRSMCRAERGIRNLRLVSVVDYFCFGFTKRAG